MTQKKEIPYPILYEKMYLIRRFETRLLELHSQGKLSGTTHTYVGQEAVAVSVIHHLVDTDIVFSSHRCHGHYIAFTDDVLNNIKFIRFTCNHHRVIGLL